MGHGSDGFIQTFTIPDDGSSITKVATREHNNAYGGWNSLVQVDYNTYALAYRGYESNDEYDLLHTAIALNRKTAIALPIDVVVGQEFSADAAAVIKRAEDVSEDDMIFDVGPKSQSQLADIIASAKTIIWNGPLGVFELDQFGTGTEAIAKAIASSNAFSIAGGGDTLAAIEKYQVAKKISYISTGGGAFLEFVEGKKLPALEILENRFIEAAPKTGKIMRPF